MIDPAISALVLEVRALPEKEAFRLYLNLLAGGRDRAQIVALAIRDKARAGEISEEHIPLLAACLEEAPDPATVVHLAKAAAAFGRKAQDLAPILVNQIRGLTVVDDNSYWIVDGALWSLAYLGGEDADAYFSELQDDKVSVAVRSDSVYRGEMPRAEREKRFAKTLAGCIEVASAADPGVWRDKKTALVAKKTKAQPARQSALSLRAR